MFHVWFFYDVDLNGLDWRFGLLSGLGWVWFGSENGIRLRAKKLYTLRVEISLCFLPFLCIVSILD